ncbi:MAG: hypothetical protein JW957_07310 [Candidatus Omnitrophica bacterium]|nr:hypothetical protein [Candidatus Omnitrophota bacterium]
MKNMNRLIMLFTALLLAATGFAAAQEKGELDLRPIESSPEPLGELHPQLSWMKEEKVRVIWMGANLYDRFGDGDKTVGQVLVESGFNLAVISMGVNSDNNPSGFVAPDGPAEHDRTRSASLETRLAANVEAAREAGISLMISWQYGTHNLEPYRKWRNPAGKEARITPCPLDEEYIKGQHIGKWADAIVRGGADGMLLDMEMYHSDTHWPDGYCTCDACFKRYLKEYAGEPEAVYAAVAPEDRGKWLADHGAVHHYTAFKGKRLEALYDSIRARAHAVNPAFFFGVAPQLSHFYPVSPGVERGLGTSQVPCLIFSEHEYSTGPYAGTLRQTYSIRKTLPALFLSGAFVAVQSPEMMAGHALTSSLYSDGWFAWYGNALVQNVGAGEEKKILPYPYGRRGNSSAGDYLDRIAESHRRVEALLAGPPEDWPAWRDGKLSYLTEQLIRADGAAVAARSDETVNALKDARESLERYYEYCDQVIIVPYWNLESHVSQVDCQ